MDTIMIDINKIKSDPNQPRKNFTGLEELAKNIMLEGQIHPIEVDSNYMIIVGERRYRAIKSLGIKEIKATVNTDRMTPYERLRRQMSENLHQSAAKNGDSMPPIDTAKGWVKLYELRTGKGYNPGEYPLVSKETKGGKQLVGMFKEIADEIGANKETVWQLLQLLNEPELVQKAIEQGTPRTYFRVANGAPKKVRKQIKDKILKGEYTSREEIQKDVLIAKKLPDLAFIELHRNKAKENVKVNGILNGVSYLALALEKIKLEEVNEYERKLIKNQLNWLVNQITSYLK
jgi:hypothetical protein